MVPALLSTRSPVFGSHSLVGCSTGFMEDDRGDWPRLLHKAASVSSLAVELSVISEPELDGLVAYLSHAPRLPFRYVSVHGPSKARELSEHDLVDRLVALPRWVDAVVMHPDTLVDVAAYRPLGRRLLLENMDSRKTDGRTAFELERFFEALPEAGLCFDVAHAKSINETMAEGTRILRRYASRLRHVHLSSLDAEDHHVMLTQDDQRLFWPLLGSCRDVPWILEAPPPS
jgi:sugar phosphate isomerase/epimerase